MTALALVLAAGLAAAAPLTEADAVALALRSSPQLKAQGHFIDEATALTEVGLAWNNPHLRVQGLRYDELIGPAVDRRSYGDHPFYHTSIALRWNPPGLGERGARRAEGLARETDARMEQAMARRDTTALVRKLHAEILSWDAEIALDREVIEQRAKLSALVKSRVEQHAATLLDESLAEVDYLDARTQLAEVEVRRRGAYDELLLQLGLPAGERVELVSSSATCTPPEEATTLAERAHAANPRLRILDAEDTAVDAELRRRWLNLVPWFDYAQVGYGMAGDTRPSYVAFEFQLTLPILDWKRPHRRALSARHRALAERAYAEDRIVSDLVLRAAAAQTEQAALVARYREAASVVAGGLARLREALEQGRITNLFEVVQVQARLLATQRSYLHAQLECKLQQIELDRITNRGVDP